MPDPMLFNVPTMSSHTVGRDADIRLLWQNLLSGHRVQAVVGLDGIGKSTIAAEFCDCAKRSKRFSCIQWFNGTDTSALKDQLQGFMAAMKGRRETEVLLVIDDVASVAEAASQIPKHAHLCALITSKDATAAGSEHVHVTHVSPLHSDAAARFVGPLLAAEGPGYVKLFEAVTFVPILMRHVVSLLERHVSHDTILAGIHGAIDTDTQTLSVSKVLTALLRLSLEHVEASHPGATSVLGTLACMHIAHLSPQVLRAVFSSCGVVDMQEGFALACSEIGLLTHKWDNDGFSMHSMVAQALRKLSPDQNRCLDNAARAVASMWPRRWRGVGTDEVLQLVWHTCALLDNIEGPAVGSVASPKVSNEALLCLDRAATYCAHVEGRDLRVAARLWSAALQHHLRAAPAQPEEVHRIALECGKLLHVLRDPQASSCLQLAVQAASEAFGDSSAQYAVAVALQCPYLDDMQETCDCVTKAIAALRSTLASTDDIRSQEEILMLHESIGTLLVRKMQVLRALQAPAAEVESVWNDVQRLKQQLAAVHQQARETSQRRRR